MTLELFVLLMLVSIFLISFCGFIQKMRYFHDKEKGLINEFPTETPRDDTHDGVFPGGLMPPPYYITEHQLPPKYEDVFKNSEHVVIEIGATRVPQIVPVHTSTAITENVRSNFEELPRPYAY